MACFMDSRRRKVGCGSERLLFDDSCHRRDGGAPRRTLLRFSSDRRSCEILCGRQALRRVPLSLAAGPDFALLLPRGSVSCHSPTHTNAGADSCSATTHAPTSSSTRSALQTRLDVRDGFCSSSRDFRSVRFSDSAEATELYPRPFV